MDTAVLLAAGRGTRMGDATLRTPKPLLAVAGRPILEHILSGLRAAGIERAIVVTGYLGEQIEAAFGDGARLGMRIDYLRQERPEGTARAFVLAAPLLGADPFVLGWGDVLVYPEFYAEFLRAYRQRPCELQVAVNEVDDPWRGAAVHFREDGRVTAIEEKPPPGTAGTRWNNAGLFVGDRTLFDYARRLAPTHGGEYVLPVAMARMVCDGRFVRAVPIRGFWSDVGTPEDLLRAQGEFPAARGGAER